MYDRYGELAHTLDSLVRVSRRAGHTYGSTHMNAARLCMHTASVIANRAPGVILALPVQLLHEFDVEHNIHTCMSVSGWTGYTVHLCIDYTIRYVVHMARFITDCNNPPNTTDNTNVATGYIIITATISPASHYMSISLYRIHVRITIFSKFFSQLPHGTCSLSVSGMYQYFDEL